MMNKVETVLGTFYSRIIPQLRVGVSLVSVCVLLGFNASAQNPNYVLQVNAPGVVVGTPGQVVQFEAVVEIVALQDPVQGWSVGVIPSDTGLATIVAATTQGTVAADINDDPPGLRSTGFENTELSVIPPGGAISAVVLSFTQPITLTPGFSYDLLRLTVETTIPAAGVVESFQLALVDGLEGSGQPVNNVLTVNGATVTPTVLAAEVLVSSSGDVPVPLGSGFTYQGRVDQGGTPFNGVCDLEFGLWHHATSTNSGLKVGLTQVVPGVVVQDGVFTVSLNDSNEFGPSPFENVQTWLEIGVRAPSGSGVFTTLSPRQRISVTPQAAFAKGASWTGLTDVPFGFADGVDNIGATSWSALTGVPSGFADGIDNEGASSWSQLSGIPSGFADGVDNVGTPPYYGNAADTAGLPSFSWPGDEKTGLFRPTSSTLALSTGGSERLRIDASGQVGIGTTAPLNRLDVRGNAGIGAGLTPNTLTESNLLNLYVGMQGDGNRNGIAFYENTSGYAMRLGYNGVLSGAANKLVIYDNSAAERFVFRNGGQMGIGVSNPAQALEVSGNIVATGTVTGGSDKHRKENFEDVDALDILEKVADLTIQRWNYIGEETPHVGPVAQDFHGAFEVGMDDKHISMVDADGVALAAIQGLNRKVERGTQSAEQSLQQLREENEVLKARITALERLISER